MSGAMFVLVVLCAIDPPRAGLASRASALSPSARVGAGAAALLVTAALTLAADGFINWLDVRAESWRIAAGIVAGFTAVRRLVTGLPPAEPTLRVIPAAIIPGAFPIMLRPVVVMLAVTGGVDHGVGTSLAGFSVAVGLAVAAGAVAEREEYGRLWLALSKLLAALLVVGAVALIISGIADI